MTTIANCVSLSPRLPSRQNNKKQAVSGDAEGWTRGDAAARKREQVRRCGAACLERVADLRARQPEDRPTEGRVLFDAADVTGVPVQKRNVAMVYQQFISVPPRRWC
jgi:hypothetical protein